MSKRQVVTERTVVEAHRSGEHTIEIDPDSIITPLARDKANELKIALSRKPLREEPPSQSSTGTSQILAQDPLVPSVMKDRVVAIGSDHGGFQYKEILKTFITELGYSMMDVGTDSEAACDYPDFAYAVAHAIASGSAWRGIMIDGAGVGSSMVANKVPGVRAACCQSEFVARNSREHNDANVLTLGSRVIGTEVAKEIVRAWLATSFAGGQHVRRVEKIMEVEKKFTK